jgi:hypothetical protein
MVLVLVPAPTPAPLFFRVDSGAVFNGRNAFGVAITICDSNGKEWDTLEASHARAGVI